MKLNDLTPKDHAKRALKENFEVDFKVNQLTKVQTQGMLNKVQSLMSEARDAKKLWGTIPSVHEISIHGRST